MNNDIVEEFLMFLDEYLSDTAVVNTVKIEVIFMQKPTRKVTKGIVRIGDVQYPVVAEKNENGIFVHSDVFETFVTWEEIKRFLKSR